MATFVYARSQGQRMHSARTKIRWHTENQPPRMSGSSLKVLLVGWVVLSTLPTWVEVELGYDKSFRTLVQFLKIFKKNLKNLHLMVIKNVGVLGYKKVSWKMLETIWDLMSAADQKLQTKSSWNWVILITGSQPTPALTLVYLINKYKTHAVQP